MKFALDAIPNRLLKEMRLSRGWSQGDVAEDIGVSKDAYARWERGKTFPQPYYRERLRNLFQVSAEELGFPQELEKAVISSQEAETRKVKYNAKLRYMRQFWGWRRSFVANQIGVSLLTYSRWERGEERPYLYYQQRLCVLFETNIKELGFAQEQEVTDISSQQNLASKNISNTKLKSLRAFRGWSQKEVAKQIGTYPMNLSRWERGEAKPNPFYQQELRKLFIASDEELGLV